MEGSFIETIKKILLSSGFADAGLCVFDKSLCFTEEELQRKLAFIPKTVLSGLVPYYKKEKMGQNLSIYAVSRDYHLVLTEKMNKAIETLKSLFPDASFQGFCDNSPIIEVKAAVLSGLGVRGQNNLLLHKKYGSFVNLCTILTDMPVSCENSPPKSCEGCGACIRACPGGALTKDSFFKERCLSFLTQKKGELTKEETELIKKGNRIWGCDVCQTVCPHNKGIEEAKTEPPHIHRLTYEELEHLSDHQFKEKYKETAFTWRGKAPLLRNIKLLK